MIEIFSTSFSIFMMRQIIMIRRICCVNETDDSDGICDDCKFNVIRNDDMSP